MRLSQLVVVSVFALVACGTNPYQQELVAYRDYLQSEINAGRLSVEQGNYMLAQKQNELRERQSAALNAAIQGMATGAAIMQQSGPYMLPNSAR
jgi:hypothetical protein